MDTTRDASFDDLIDHPLILPGAPAVYPRVIVPLVTVMLPAVAAAATWRLTGQSIALWLGAFGVLLAIAGLCDGLLWRLQARRAQARARAKALVQVRSVVEERHDRERGRAWMRHPGLERLLAQGLDRLPVAAPPGRGGRRGARLVVGAGSVASSVVLGGAADDAREADDLRREAGELTDAPVVIPLAAGLAVRGPSVCAEAARRAMERQVCAAFGVDAADAVTIRVCDPAGTVPDDCGALLTLTAPDRGILTFQHRTRLVRIEALSREQACDVDAALAARAGERHPRLAQRIGDGDGGQPVGGGDTGVGQ